MKKQHEEKIYSIGVARVSSDKQAQEGESLGAQRASIARFAESKGWENMFTFNFSISGRTEMEKIVNEIDSFLDGISPKPKFCIWKQVDRITRAGTDGFSLLSKVLKKHSVEIIDTIGLIQPERNTLEELGIEYDWSKYSPSESSLTLEIIKAKDEVRNILTRLITSEVNLVRNGYRVREAPDGFLNKRIYVNGKKKYVLEPDPARYHFFLKMFELRAQGSLSDEEIVAQINAMGYRSKPRTIWSKPQKNERHISIEDRHPIGKTEPKILTVKKLQRIITRPVYAGFNCEIWTNHKLIKGHFEGIAPIDLFNRANRGKVFIKEDPDGTYELLFDYSPVRQLQKRNKDNPDFPFKFIRCDKCGKSFLASSPKGKSGQRFPIYHCGNKNNKVRDHQYLGIPKEVFDAQAEKLLSSLIFNDEYLEVLEKVMINKYREREKEVVEVSSSINLNIAHLQTQQSSYLNQLMNTESKVARKKIEEKIEELELIIDNARNKRDEVEIEEHDIRSYIRNAKYMMEHMENLLINPDDFAVQRALIDLVFDVIPTYSEIVNGTPKLAYTFKLSEQFKRDKSLVVSSCLVTLNFYRIT